MTPPESMGPPAMAAPAAVAPATRTSAAPVPIAAVRSRNLVMVPFFPRQVLHLMMSARAPRVISVVMTVLSFPAPSEAGADGSAGRPIDHATRSGDMRADLGTLDPRRPQVILGDMYEPAGLGQGRELPTVIRGPIPGERMRLRARNPAAERLPRWGVPACPATAPADPDACVSGGPDQPKLFGL